MRQSPRVDSPPLSQARSRAEVEASTPEPLHPVLRSALACLEVQLESELARYRRDRLGRAPRPLRKQSSSSLDLISVSAMGGRTHPLPESSPAPSPGVNHLQASELSRIALGEPLPALAASTLSSTFADSLNPSMSGANLAIAVKAPDSELSVGRDAAGDRPMLDSMVSDSHLANLAAGLDDYLESSEELLRSLTAEEEAVQVERGFIDSLLTPLGVGSMLLLLVSSAMFGYVVMNPPSLGRLFATQSADPATGDGAIAPSVPQTTMASPQPNLAAKEFNDLNLNTLGTVPVKPGIARPTGSPPAKATNLSTKIGATGVAGAGIGATAPASATGSPARHTPPSEEAATTTPQPPTRVSEPAQTASPRRTVAVREPMRAPAPPSTRPVPSSAAGYDYKLVTHYDGDRTLEAARKVVPDAYVRNFPDGARIQLGAYGNASEAEARAQQLRSQGINAEIQKR